MILPKKRYLGDGVYAAFDERGVVLTTENGIETTNTIVFEPEVLHSFLGFVNLVLDIEKETKADEPA